MLPGIDPSKYLLLKNAKVGACFQVDGSKYRVSEIKEATLLAQRYASRVGSGAWYGTSNEYTKEFPLETIVEKSDGEQIWYW